jgi:hypothetical protein
MIDNRHAKRNAARRTASALKTWRETPRPRILMILLAVVALTIQMLVIQSHVHAPQLVARAQSASLITLVGGTADTQADHAAGAPRAKYPVNEDPSNCPLCQAFGHSGQFVASTAVLVSLPYFIAVGFIVFSESIPALFAVRHSWQSRAPPQG